MALKKDNKEEEKEREERERKIAAEAAEKAKWMEAKAMIDALSSGAQVTGLRRSYGEGPVD